MINAAALGSVAPLVNIPFDDWRPCFIASLSAGATYAQAGTVVTVTSTAHGIPSLCNGSDWYWPGSAAIPAGVYKDWTYVSADSFTFTNPAAQTIAAGAAVLNVPMTSIVMLKSATVPRGVVSENGQLTLHASRRGDSTANIKRIYLIIDGNQNCSIANGGTSNTATCAMTIRGLGSSKPNTYAYSSGGNADSVGASSQTRQTIDFSADKTAYLALFVTAAQQWTGVDMAFLEARKWQ